MNWSLYTADRATHLKIVVVGLAAALVPARRASRLDPTAALQSS